MDKLMTVGLDLAKNVFHLVSLDSHGKVVKKKCLRRHQVLAHFANLPASRVGTEACRGAHYRARELGALGHEVRLLPAQHVKAGYTEAILSLPTTMQYLARDHIRISPSAFGTKYIRE